MLDDAGIPVICADEPPHEVVKPDSPAFKEIREDFGVEVFDEDGGLDRVAMGNVLFHDKVKRQTPESIIHRLELLAGEMESGTVLNR